MAKVALVKLVKKFRDVIACDNISLEIGSGELVTLLGPSGCGKTTTLNCIAGFIEPDSGEVCIDDVPVTGIAPHKRGLGMCFQTWALWPHMSIYENVAFGLKIRKVTEHEIRNRVSEALALVRLSGLDKRFPRQLSGGQQQRAALARALVIEPKVLLLDEPLSNLDAKLRQETRVEVKQLIKRLGVTTIYVTHDQEEALEISDRIAVMNKGRIVQIGAPIDIYQDPGNPFVAYFLGEINTLPGVVSEILEDSMIVETSDFRVRAPRKSDLTVGDKVTISIRPEDILLDPRPQDLMRSTVTLHTEISQASFRGAYYRYRVSTKSGTLISANSKKVLAAKDMVTAAFAAEKCLVLERS